jgi:hypothetical protein
MLFVASTPTAQLLVGLAGLQIVIQIAIFLILFMSMADTFLFRVGFLGGCCLLNMLIGIFCSLLGWITWTVTEEIQNGVNGPPRVSGSDSGTRYCDLFL